MKTREKNFSMTLNLIQRAINGLIVRRKYYWRESKKEMPYKCRTKTDAIKSKRYYKKEISYINIVLKEYRAAIKILSKTYTNQTLKQ